jgi:hypothetical protein
MSQLPGKPDKTSAPKMSPPEWRAGMFEASVDRLPDYIETMWHHLPIEDDEMPA